MADKERKKTEHSDGEEEADLGGTDNESQPLCTNCPILEWKEEEWWPEDKFFSLFERETRTENPEQKYVSANISKSSFPCQ